MKVLLIGDSILCNYAFGDKNRTKASLNVDEVEIIRVQSMATYITAFDYINDYDIVMVSTLLNQVSALENKWPSPEPFDEAKSTEIASLITDIAKTINEAAKEAPNTKIVVIPPTIRTTPKWLYDCFDEFSAFYLSELDSKVKVAPKPPISDVDLRADGVHLKDLANKRFRDYVREIVHPPISWDEEVSSPVLSQRPAVEVFESDDVNEAPVRKEDNAALARVESMLQKIVNNMSVTAQRNEKTEAKVIEITKNHDELVMKHHVNAARLKEEIDGLSNAQRHHLIIVKKMKRIVGVMTGESRKEKADSLLKYVRELVDKLPMVNIEKPVYYSLYLIPTPEKDETFQDFRLICGSKRDAVELRNRILNARQAKTDPWANAEISNDPVKATRVRLFLLQCIARSQRKTFKGDVIVNKFADSPNIIFKKDGRVTKQLSFVDAILQHKSEVTRDELLAATRIAGRAYESSLREYFLVLNENHLPQGNAPSSSTAMRQDSNSESAKDIFTKSVKRRHSGTESEGPKRRK